MIGPRMLKGGREGRREGGRGVNKKLGRISSVMEGREGGRQRRRDR